MPSHVRIDGGFAIVAAAPGQQSEPQYWSWNWFGENPPDGGNKGPVIFQAVPKNPEFGGNNTARNVLMTYDVTTCRAGPDEPGSPEVSTSLSRDSPRMTLIIAILICLREGNFIGAAMLRSRLIILMNSRSQSSA
jgi:hypothetical protein